jgi:hypothetical protein
MMATTHKKLEGEPKQTADQSDGQNGRHRGGWALFLAEHPGQPFVRTSLRGRTG